MADTGIKISALPAAAALDGSEAVPVVQGGATKKATPSQITAYVKTGISAADVGAIPAAEKGAANGVASLDGAGIVPAAQLPSYVDDVVEGYYYEGAFYADAAHTQEITGETGKIYVDLPSSDSYRWGGSAYVKIANPITVDDALSDSSTNPVQNRILTAEARELQRIALGAYPTETASGSVASFDDGADGIPIKALTVSMTPQQSGSGEASLDNARPFVGRTSATIYRLGKNLIPFAYPYPDTNKYVEATVDGCNVRVRNTQASTYAACNFYPPLVWTSTFKSGIKLTWSADIEIHSGAAAIGLRSAANNTFGAGSRTNITQSGHYTGTITLTDARYFSLCCTWSTAEMGDVEFNNLQLEIGSAETAAEPYQGKAYPVQFGSAGTVYSGTPDVVTGLLTVDYARKVLDGSSTIIVANVKENTTTISYYTPVADNVVNPTALDLSAAYCDKLPSVAYIYNADVLGIYVPVNHTPGPTGAGFIYLSIPAAAGSTVESIKAWLAENPLEILYKLATPKTYQFTPAEVDTLLGANNIFCDAGDVDVTIRADPTLYINDKVAALTALISES